MKKKYSSIKLGLTLIMVFSLSACSLNKKEELGEIHVVEKDEEKEVEVQKVDTDHIPQGKDINNIVSLYSYNRKDIDEFGFSALLPSDLKLKKNLTNKNVLVFSNNDRSVNPYKLQISVRRFHPKGKTPEILQVESLDFMRKGYRYFSDSKGARIASYNKGELEIVKDKDQEIYFDNDLHDDYMESFSKEDFLNPKKDFKRLYIREPLGNLRFSGNLFESESDSNKIYAENFYFNIDNDSYLVTVSGDSRQKEYVEEIGVMFASTYRLELIELSTEVYGGLDYQFTNEYSRFNVPEEFNKEYRWGNPFIYVNDSESVLKDVMLQYHVYGTSEDPENLFNPFFSKEHQTIVAGRYANGKGAVIGSIASLVTSIVNDESIGVNGNSEVHFYEYMINDIKGVSEVNDMFPVALPLFVYETVFYNYEKNAYEIITFVSPAHKKDMVRSLAIEVSQTYKAISK